MKKLFSVLILAACILLLVGCGKTQKLTCIYINSNVTVDYGIEYKGSEVVKMHVNYDVDYTKVDESLVKEKQTSDLATITESVSVYPIKNKSNKVENNHLYANFDLDPAKIKENGEKFETIEEAKTGLESVGYKCTIE